MTLTYGWSGGKFVLLVQDENKKILHRISLTPDQFADVWKTALTTKGETKTVSHQQMI